MFKKLFALWHGIHFPFESMSWRDSITLKGVYQDDTFTMVYLLGEWILWGDDGYCVTHSSPDVAYDKWLQHLNHPYLYLVFWDDSDDIGRIHRYFFANDNSFREEMVYCGLTTDVALEWKKHLKSFDWEYCQPSHSLTIYRIKANAIPHYPENKEHF